MSMTGYYHLPTWEYIIQTVDHVEHVKSNCLIRHITFYVSFSFQLVFVSYYFLVEKHLRRGQSRWMN